MSKSDRKNDKKTKETDDKPAFDPSGEVYVTSEWEAEWLKERGHTGTIRLSPSVSPKPHTGDDGFHETPGGWSIRYGDKQTVCSLKGVNYIAYLFENPFTPDTPNNKFEIFDLIDAVEPERLSNEKNTPKKPKTEDVTIDARMRKELQDELRPLYEQRTNAEAAGKENAYDHFDGEIKRIMEPLEKAYGKKTLDGLFGGYGDIHGQSKEVRNAVNGITKLIREAIAKIKKGIPSLGHYLDTHIQTGHLMKYTPDPEVPLLMPVIRRQK
ncbi:hypothetical protein ACFL4G_09010 [Thermodesulfobacteriota bacterium]